jgi:hypothetical protein
MWEMGRTQSADAFQRLEGGDYLPTGRFLGISFTSRFSIMKTSNSIVTLLAFILVSAITINGAYAQTAATPTQSPVASQPTLLKGTNQIIERGANYRVWQRTDYEITPDGKKVPRTHKFTELATGLSVQRNGQWVESRAEISILPDGTAAATNGQHQVRFPGDIAKGVITLNTPDGLVLQSRPIALSYDDGSNTVLIAVLTNSTGILLGSNEVIYPNAFEGISARLHYRYYRAGFEQDVELDEQPPAPQALGLNPNTTRLQVITEFFTPPQPNVTVVTVPTAAGNLTDQELDFGVIKTRPGKAFLVGTNGPSARMHKQWVTVDGRQLLVEEVPLISIANDLSQLPAAKAVSLKSGPDSPLYIVSAKRLLPPQPVAETHPDRQARIQLAQATFQSRGLMLDYVMVNSSINNYTFQGDTTYLISGPVYLSGQSTFEGGSVIKYAPANSVPPNSPGPSLNIQLYGTIQTLSTPYRPVIFTAREDDSVGEDCGSEGGPPGPDAYANPALSYDESYGSQPIALNNFRIGYAKTAISATAYTINVCLNNGQVVGCGTVLYSEGWGSATFKNVLFANDSVIANVSDVNVTAQNCTLTSPDPWGHTYLIKNNDTAWSLFCSLNLVNCIVANFDLFVDWDSQGYVSISADHTGFYNNDNSAFGTSPVTANANPFVTAGGGNYYLANGCPFTNAGTANIDGALLAALRNKTTHPPLLRTNLNIASATTWTPQIARDTNSPPDLGYHYDPIDYLVCDVNVDNTTLTLTGGVAVACMGEL